ncbi:MAG: TIGR04283 family arsenosugar biosynthesis glycosyltransferase [Leptospirales bacterium]|nr:TIGR04283 family arsenosugar biosynthesis glycosyltransferase [Leptospirales bacterium]
MKLSVIIPTLNEAESIERTIRAVRAKAAGADPEIVVSDCGSTDRTADIAHALNVTVIQDERMGSRAEAANRGAQNATGDTFFFLDADTLPPDRFDAEIARVLEDSSVVGGAFDFGFDGDGLSLRLIELVSRLRFRLLWQEYYSDQGVFVKREAFNRIGGFPARRLMETAHLCKKLRSVGRLRLSPVRSLTSSRRFTEGGIWRVFLRDVKIWFLDAIGMETDRFAHEYRENNVQRARQTGPHVESGMNTRSAKKSWKNTGRSG